MKNNYPIKYAVIPMIEQIGWNHGMHELEREYGVVCYIVSKCYLIEETKKYNIDGTTTTKYQVVCPFNKDEYQNWCRREPSYNLIHGECTNGIITDVLFDNFDEAKVVKDQKNEILLLQKFSYMPVNTYKVRCQEIEDEFNKTIDYYNKLESEIENSTIDLLINNKSKEQCVLRLKGNKYKKIDYSLYEIINTFNSDDYIVYSVTNEEFTKLQELIDNINYNNHVGVPLLINNGKLKVVEVVSTTGEKIYLTNNKLVKQIEDTFIIPNNYDEIFYTIENYEDIIKSYKNNCDNSKVIKLIRK